MSGRRHARQKKLLELVFVAAFLFSVTSVLRTLRVSQEVYKQSASSAISNNQAPAKHQHRNMKSPKLKMEQKLMFQPKLDIELPIGYEVQLHGLKELPENFQQRSNVERSRFRFLMQPSRIIGNKGLLAIREFQGSSWTGTLMKGAIVFFVQSSAKHRRRRMLQRSTWGSIRDIEGWKLEIVFVVGNSSNSSSQADLFRENATYGDVLQFHGPDHEHFSAHKVLASLDWAVERLPSDFYFASVTDDVLVDVAAVRDHISSQASHSIPVQDRVYTTIARDGSTVTSSKPQKIYCFEKYLEEEEPLRDPFYWRSVPMLDYEAPLWPPYCSEALYILPVSMARELYEESRLLKASLPLELHDVFVTGILRRKLNRGDENIVSAGKNAPLRRFEVLARTTSRRLASYEIDAENQVKTTWLKWYEKIHYRFHILTHVTPL